MAIAPLACFAGQSPEIVTLTAVRFSPDGQALVTLSWSQTPRHHPKLRVWDLATGYERESERRMLADVALIRTDDGNRLVLKVDGDGTRPLADLTDWRSRPWFDGRFGGLGCLAAMSPDGRTLATARHRADRDGDTRVQLWDIATGRLVKSFDDGLFVDMLAFSPDGRILAGARGRLVAWDVETGAVRGWTKTVARAVAPLAFAPDGSTLAVQGGGKITLIDPSEGKVRGALNYLQASAMAFSPESRRLAVAYDEEVAVWDLGSLQPVIRFDGHVRPRVIENLRQEVDHFVRTVASRTGLPLRTSTANEVWSVAFSPDGRSVASGDLDGTARVWDATTGRESFRFDHRGSRSPRLVGVAMIWAIAWGVIAWKGCPSARR